MLKFLKKAIELFYGAHSFWMFKDCGPDPIPFSIPMMGSEGNLVPGGRGALPWIKPLN